MRFVIKDILRVSRFRWAACQLDSLEKCLDFRTLQTALASLPKTLDETYDRILDSIPDEHKPYAIRILQFLTFSERPLRIKEAVDAIAVDTEGDQHFNPHYRMPIPQEISYYCSSLVVVIPTKKHLYGEDEYDGGKYDEDEYDGDKYDEDQYDEDEYDENEEGEDENEAELQLAHFSVKEYLTSTRINEDMAQIFKETTARASIAKVCLAYLLHFDWDIPPEEIREAFPLAQYSARFWMTHAAVAEDKDKRLLDFIEQFFCYRERSYKICYSLFRPDRPWNYAPANSEDEPASALYYAAFGGLLNAVKCLLSQGADIDAQGGYYGTALQAASAKGYEKIVELLLGKGADVDAGGGYYGTALHAASTNGHEKIVYLLLGKGADVDARDEYYCTALQAASAGGHEKIVELLLNKGADVDAGGEYYSTALHVASTNGHEKIVELLLGKGAEVEARRRFNGVTALQAASAEGHKKIVELLLDKGADVDARGGYYCTALQEASANGHEKIVELLLAKGADVDARGGYYGTALQAASGNGHEKIVELLRRSSSYYLTRSLTL
jgi:ankyrin repeat protein